jgi:acyl-CoA synthetase (AMP-forming)/AMP-acid ligase II
VALSSPAATWGLRDVLPEQRAEYLREGWWNDDTLGTILARGLAAHPELTFSIRSERRPYRGTLGNVFDLARRVAAGLRARGIEPGDVVAFQLPNWVEAAATFWATTFLGAVVVPIVHFYGPKEVGYILRRSDARVLITADHFGHQDFLANLDGLRAELPALELVAVVGDSGVPGYAVDFRALVAESPLAGPLSADPNSPALVAYTSGTTSDPKGVVHSHRTIGFEIRQLGAIQPNQAPHPESGTLTGAPVGHGIGMLAALLLPVWRGEPIYLIDLWDPKAVLAGMLEDHLVSGAGATYFLTSLLDHPDFSPAHLALMAHVGLGGSAVPAAVTERATELGISVVRSFGSTEHPSITGNTHDQPLATRIYTDGRPLLGVQIRLVDASGNDVTAGTPGEILSRGPDCFIGYTDPARTREAFDANGWFATGDIGVLDDDGFLAIVDRKKDIIIRGGENISALEVEEQLLRVAGVAEAAVVAAPDARLGEHACAFVRLLPGATAPSLDDVRAHLEASGMARQKWPEDLRVVDDFPRTPSGKVQKYVLRERVRTSD